MQVLKEQLLFHYTTRPMRCQVLDHSLLLARDVAL